MRKTNFAAIVIIAMVLAVHAGCGSGDVIEGTFLVSEDEIKFVTEILTRIE